MVTVDLFRLSRSDLSLGHVRILREHNRLFHAVVSYRNTEEQEDTQSYRLVADTRNHAIMSVLSWANKEFGGHCVLLPLRSAPRSLAFA
ncbi:hypothetical protein FHR99_002133 [Litorivivens lipolytica]|uniref:Uncharacterized protein n=1 Tax=Litorivivens lipolytica TaxID=1524264 RepID=A0A7W4Z666_9GAMM|nr:hypothetical protein [Litorivivens lipolytica]MBB3047867.1 hypothetical protein [Litorivivens lipolytica]